MAWNFQIDSTPQKNRRNTSKTWTQSNGPVLFEAKLQPNAPLGAPGVSVGLQAKAAS